MKPEPTLITLLIVATIVGMVTVNIQQVSAPRTCGSCVEFKKLTHEFEKNVVDAATIGDPGLISGLLEKYNQAVRALDFTLNN
jgi:hypothetical protein